MIAIIDLELGNLYSVKRAVEHMGCDCIVTDQVREIVKADKIILPGVGSYKSGMDSISSKKLHNVITSFAGDGLPVLGICLGMQLLMDHSDENGSHAGLGLIPGKVRYFKKIKGFNSKVKVPNISWCSLNKNRKLWNGTLLDQIKEGEDCYFVHSLCVLPDNENDELAVSQYGGTQFASVIERQNIMGCQFHPEKSGDIGLNIIGNFINYKARI